MAALPHLNKNDQLYHTALAYLRYLKATVNQISEQLEEDSVPNIQIMERLFRRVEEYYNKCESLANQMPDKMPTTDALQKLAVEYQEEFLPDYEDSEMSESDLSTLHGKPKIEQYIDSINWLDSYNQFSHFAMQLSKMSANAQRKRPMVLDVKPQTFTRFTPDGHPHVHFMKALSNLKQDAMQKRFGIWINVLENSAFSSIVELRTGNVVERQTIITQKTLIVENNGMADMLIFIAPHEEWRYLDHFGEYGGRKVDLMQRSRYFVYQKLTAIANQSLPQLLGMGPDGKSAQPANVIQNIFLFVTKYHKVFETKCKICGNVMKDCLPPILYDPRQPQESFHESCR